MTTSTFKAHWTMAVNKYSMEYILYNKQKYWLLIIERI